MIFPVLHFVEKKEHEKTKVGLWLKRENQHLDLDRDENSRKKFNFFIYENSLNFLYGYLLEYIIGYI